MSTTVVQGSLFQPAEAIADSHHVAGRQCPRCGAETVRMTLTPDLVHFGRLDCTACDRFIAWAPRQLVLQLLAAERRTGGAG